MPEPVDPQAFLKYMCRFLVSVGCNSMPPPNSGLPEKKFFTSGFVLEVNGDWYYASCGHVFNDIAQYMHCHPEYSNSFVMHGGMGTYAVDEHAISFAYRPPTFAVDRDKGLDFGAVKLNAVERQYLQGNSVIVVSEQMWDQELAPAFSNYFAIGLPRQYMSLDIPLYASIQPVYLQLDSTTEIEPQYRSQTDKMRYFRVPSGSELDLDLIGMSGCPVFALRENPGASAEVTVCALQSSWLPSRRFLAAVDLRFAASALRSGLSDSSVIVDSPAH